MSILNRVTLAALLLSTATSSVYSENTIDTTQLPVSSLIGLNQNFFAQPSKISNTIRDIAYATLEMGFVKWTDKDVIFCDYKAYENTVKNSKYSKGTDGNLTPVKSEEYTGPANGSAGFTKCVHKGKTARSTIQLQEGAARLFRATTKPEDITQVSLVSLYNDYIPLCIQAKSAKELHEFVLFTENELSQNAIAPLMRAQEEKPLCVVLINSDPLLRSIDDELWNRLTAVYNVTTFYDAAIRTYVLSMRESLCDMVKDAKDGLDINPSFLEGLFDDLSANNHAFSLKKMAREIISNILSVKGIVGTAAGIALYKWYIHEHVVNTGSYVADSIAAKWNGTTVDELRIDREAHAKVVKDAHETKVTARIEELKKN